MRLVYIAFQTLRVMVPRMGISDGGAITLRIPWQLTANRQPEHKVNEVTVECRCKSCGKKFKVHLYPEWKPDEPNEKTELELDVKCQKCGSSDVTCSVTEF
jgi:Zn finger protein HypA/HybF involved in hydrogenase expression